MIVKTQKKIFRTSREKKSEKNRKNSLVFTELLGGGLTIRLENQPPKISLIFSKMRN